MPPTALLTPDTVDLEAAALYDTAAWQHIVTNWAATAPEPTPRAGTEATELPTRSGEPTGDWRHLLTVPVDQLITTALAQIPRHRRPNARSQAASAPPSPTGSTPGAVSARPTSAPPSTSPTPARS